MMLIVQLMMAEIERPDAILLDVNLPDSSGISTLDRLRQVRPDVPIIMVECSPFRLLTLGT